MGELCRAPLVRCWCRLLLSEAGPETLVPPAVVLTRRSLQGSLSDERLPPPASRCCLTPATEVLFLSDGSPPLFGVSRIRASSDMRGVSFLPVENIETFFRSREVVGVSVMVEQGAVAAGVLRTTAAAVPTGVVLVTAAAAATGVVRVTGTAVAGIVLVTGTTATGVVLAAGIAAAASAGVSRSPGVVC